MAMKGRRWAILLGVLVAVVPIVAWLFRPPGRMPEEFVVAERLRTAKALYIKVNVANEVFSGPERLALDGEALARAFRIKEKHGRKTVTSNRRVELLTSPDGGDEILPLSPPSAVFIDVILYTIEPGFWTELLRQAPKTKAWLEEKAPDLFEAGVPCDR